MVRFPAFPSRRIALPSQATEVTDTRSSEARQRDVQDWLGAAQAYLRSPNDWQPPPASTADGEFRIPPFRVPPIGESDTIRADVRTGVLRSVRGPAPLLFREASEVLEIAEQKALASPMRDIELGVTRAGRHVLLQPGQRACALAAGAMLALDRQRPVRWDSVLRANLAGASEVEWFFRQSGLETFETPVPKISDEVLPRWLKWALQTSGSAWATTYRIGGHAILIDDVDLPSKSIWIRDPFHGWACRTPLGPSGIIVSGSLLQVR